MSASLITVDIYFDHLVKLVSAWLAHCKVFAVDKYLAGDTLRSYKSCWSSDFYSLILVSAVDLGWNIYYCGICLMVISISLFFLHLLIRFLLLPNLSIYIFIWLYPYGLMGICTTLGKNPILSLLFASFFQLWPLGTASHWILCSLTR